MKWKSRSILIILFLLFLIFFDPIVSLFENHDNDSNYGLIIAHRGASGLAPENTLAAIKRALELKADLIEIDVHQTKDSVIVVIHDKTINRTTDGEGSVKDLFYKEILKYDAGRWFDSKFEGERVPTLTDVINLVHGQTGLLIEIKGGDNIYPNIEQHVYNILKKYNAQKWCEIHSFYDQTLSNFFKIDSTLVLEKVILMDLCFFPFFIDNSINFGRLKKYKFIKGVNVNSHFLSNRVLQNLHHNDFKVYVWTVNDSSEIEEYFKMGVDGVITNFPNFKRRRL